MHHEKLQGNTWPRSKCRSAGGRTKHVAGAGLARALEEGRRAKVQVRDLQQRGQVRVQVRIITAAIHVGSIDVLGREGL